MSCEGQKLPLLMSRADELIKVSTDSGYQVLHLHSPRLEVLQRFGSQVFGVENVDVNEFILIFQVYTYTVNCFCYCYVVVVVVVVGGVGVL